MTRLEPPEMWEPHAFIQWKDTNVCMDYYCACGYHGHVDDDFVYYIKCADCGKVYDVESNIRLVPLSDDESKRVLRETPGVVKSGMLFTE